MPTPRTVKRDDMLAAINPICSLLGVDPLGLYDLTVSATAIDFSVSPGERKELASRPIVDGEAVGVVAHRYSVEVV